MTWPSPRHASAFATLHVYDDDTFFFVSRRTTWPFSTTSHPPSRLLYISTGDMAFSTTSTRLRDVTSLRRDIFFFFFDDFHPPWRRHVFATIWFHFFDMISPPRPTDDIYVAGAAAADRVHGDANRHCFSRCNCRPASPGPVQAVRLHLRVPVSGDA